MVVWVIGALDYVRVFRRTHNRSAIRPPNFLGSGCRPFRHFARDGEAFPRLGSQDGGAPPTQAPASLTKRKQTTRSTPSENTAPAFPAILTIPPAQTADGSVRRRGRDIPSRSHPAGPTGRARGLPLPQCPYVGPIGRYKTGKPQTDSPKHSTGECAPLPEGPADRGRAFSESQAFAWGSADI